MNNFLFARKARRHPIELQLTAMIDIFSMIVIFLILGSVFGGADVLIPPNTKLPKSTSIELSGQAPTVAIAGGKVRVSLVEGMEIPVERFHQGRAETDPEIGRLKARLKEAVDKIPEKDRKAGVPLNVVSDQETPYIDIFNTVRVFRDSGYSTLLFVASAQGGGKP